MIALLYNSTYLRNISVLINLNYLNSTIPCKMKFVDYSIYFVGKLYIVQFQKIYLHVLLHKRDWNLLGGRGL